MSPAAAPEGLRFEHHTEAGPLLGVGPAAPRLSWHVPTAPDDYRQSAYQVEVTRPGGAVELVTVTTEEQILVPWPVAPLLPREAVQVRVRVCGTGDDDWSAWSEPAGVERGIDDWTARFISPATLGGTERPAPVLTGTIDLPGDIVRARLYATAHGIYTAELNGERVGDHELAPGWTSYQHRLRYQTYDVTAQVRPGPNRLAVLLGNGWWRGRLGFQGRRGLYGDRLALLAQLEVTTADGTVHRLATDASWQATESAVTSDDLYDGQHTDLRLENRGTDTVDVLDADLGRLVAPDGPPVRVTEIVPAQRVWTSPRGATLIDFGQNVVGRVRLRVRGLPAGHEVVVRHAEVLEHDELGVRPLRTAKATDSYVLIGPDATGLESTLTFHGFRYAEVTGVPGLEREDLDAVVIGSDLRRTGWFDSSHELLNRFHANVVWGMRGNFVDVPTDCPQRDERLGWTGDIQVFAPTAGFLYDTAGFLGNWLADLAAEQQDGFVPFVIPDVIRQSGPAAAAWGDAATIVPWVLYQRTGDLGLLGRQLPSMRAWVDRMAELAGPDRLWSGGFQFGDWLDPTAPPDSPFQAQADPDVIATAHLARSAEIVAAAAGLLGDTAGARRYELLAAQVRAAFAREYVTSSGRVLGDAATTYALALQWSLLPSEAQRRHAGRRLADLVRVAGFRIGTGFVGTPLMTDALTDAGEPGLAYRLLLQTGCPSWLYPVTMGATTVWERWDSMLPDGGINPGEMTSFNHYALGAVADWLHRRVAGLAPAAPAWRRILVAPVPDRRLTSASARHLTPYGEASSAWQRAAGQLRLRVTVPVGASAEVHVPGAAEAVEVRHGTHEWTVPDPYREEAVLVAEPSIREVMDHPPAWDQVVAAAAAAGAGDEAQVAGRLRPYLDAPATGLIDALTAGGFVVGAAELQARLAGLSL
jgi:alpha-L-rhamnosidase